MIAQRDAAVAVTKELQRQLQTHRAQLEQTFERRTLNAERLRLHAEEKLRCAIEDRDWCESCCRQLLVLTLFLGCGGAVLGWSVGMLVLLLVGEPLVGFLLVLPAMALGMLTGLAIAKTKIQLETRRRALKKRDTRRHFEVETIISNSIGEEEQPLAPLESFSGMKDVADENSRHAEQDRREMEAEEMQVDAGSTSLLGMGWNAAWFTLCATRDIALGIYNGRDYVRGILYPSEDKHKKKQ